MKDNIFEGETKSESEFVQKFRNLSSKARKTSIKIAGAGLVSLLVLSGFTGCVDKNGDIHETTVEQSPETETPSSILNQYTTSSSPEKTNRPEETTKRPEEITKGPEETTRGPEETTTKPEETTTPSITEPSTTTPTEPATTEPSTTEEITTTPIVTPVEPEKLPGYNKDYVYPAYLTDKIHDWATNSYVKFENDTYEKQFAYLIGDAKTEILYVQPKDYKNVYDLNHEFYVYARHTYSDDNKTVVYYTKTAFDLPSDQVMALRQKRYYSSYSDYTNTLVDYMKNYKISNIETGISGLSSNLDSLNNMDMSKFAKFIGNKYVDAEILSIDCQRDSQEYKNKKYVYTITGFAYTADGKCDCFNIQVDSYDINASEALNEFVIKLINGSITKDNDRISYLNIFTRPIEDVYQPTPQAEQSEPQA